jgi:hypothetical protein
VCGDGGRKGTTRDKKKQEGGRIQQIKREIREATAAVPQCRSTGSRL